MAARTLVEQEPNYTYVSARLLLDKLRTEVLSLVHSAPTNASQADMATRYADYFPLYVKIGIKAELLDPDLARYDLKKLAAAIKPERDLAFQFLGLQTLYDRYFLHAKGNRIELPQAFFMRVAMGLAIREIDREARAIEFYDLLSSFDFMASTCSMRARCGRNCHPASSPPSLTISTAFSNRSRTTRCWRNIPADSAMTGAACAASARTSRAPMAKARAWCRFSKWPTIPPSPSIRAASARARSAPISRPGISTSRNFSTCARTPATTAAAPTT